MNAGTAGIWIQAITLWAAVAPSLALAAGWQVPTAATTYTLVGGLIVSRFGLWTFDLAVVQLLQERVPDGELGADHMDHILTAAPAPPGPRPRE